MESWFAERSVGQMLPGDHAWFSYSSQEEQDYVIGAFLRDGLLTADKVIYVTDADPHELPGLRRRDGLDLDSYLRTGQLAVLPHAETCLTAGILDPGRMAASFEDALARAERDRFRGVRITADMTWAIRQRSGRLRVLDCEAGVDAAIAPSTTAMAICQIDRRSCTRDELAALKETHEVLVGADPEFDDGVLTITRMFAPRGLRLTGELDGARHTVFAEALRAVTAQGGDIHLNLRDLRFIDLGALNMMAGAAIRMASRGSLILDEPPPDLTQVVRLVGGPMHPWLRIGTGERS
ncbi:MEDS domain-containing protein [Actinoallomurus acaciae]|uniref:MEDS domain-containing protein n=1 Tax=Actinoallomurus acaciae TaxID=502577 RepID=A0ABV5YEJ1_9ACTN